ncbi:prolyl oligopeptidase family serine peptidase [Oscillatoria sp. CS-180]|uniref:S9 family peptidase n=1 Tax=Oscillatoria sp. CS-180 TaxID=3021720 RepID=UPI00232C94CB|nr:prolyl oligopeptidase family serine peptidase [Oscillatoria sp. CS-180]MDB9525050.1 prolyl oligopeptidase family serine peptidase [Oscillatoria sp. CS-180]
MKAVFAPLFGIAVSIVSFAPTITMAQATWQQPPEPIASLLDTPWYPGVSISPNHEWLVRLERPPLTPLVELARPRLRLAGLQMNPATRGPARAYAYRGLEIQNITTGKRQPITLPDSDGIRNLRWSPQGNLLAFTLDHADGIELWVADMVQGSARRLTAPILNNTYGMPCRWISETAGLLCKLVPPNEGIPPVPASVPEGPRIEQNLGRTAPVRTYTNLLETPDDEVLFEYYVTSVLARIGLDGDRTQLTDAQMIVAATPSPDGNWILLTTLQRPFSYQVPARLFPRRTAVLDQAGQEVYRVDELPLADDIPVTFDSVRKGRRIVGWRSDRPASLYWVEALDEGDASKETDRRDAVFQLEAPFETDPTSLWTTNLRYNRILWGHDNLALGVETWYDTRQIRVWQLNPADTNTAPVLLDERDYQDSYRNPGQPVTMPGPYGRQVLMFSPDGSSLYLRGRGASPEGVYPFLDRWNLETQEKERLWQAADPFYESVTVLLDNQGSQIITRRETTQDTPNYWLQDLATGQETQLTEFADPRSWYRDVEPEILRYERVDGIALSATLYLPPGYDPQTDGPLPTLLWAYPQEFKSRDAASQVTAAENAFRRPYAYDPRFLLTQGYAIVMGPTMPIIGEGDVEPNDTYIQQLTQSAEAIVNYLTERGISQNGQIAIGGHSYGAFTTANLLAHTDLFSAGIANSGAYNRSLTPFGFQGEQRMYWDAIEAYIQMSPFTHAAKINEPLLLIHGGDDANTGTYPLQSERLYGAMKGLGGTVRWVELPLEGHGYESREAVGHVLWEMDRWLEQYLKRTTGPTSE